MIAQREISKAAIRDRIPERSVEKDYAIHWVMAGLTGTELHPRMALKGGTALRLCHFEDYRYSEDIDLTVDKGITPENSSVGSRSQLWRKMQFRLILPATSPCPPSRGVA